MTVMTWWRKVVAELVGTFFLVLVAAGLDVMGALSPGQIDRVAKAIGPGLVLAALILVLGPIGGAHFNPVVTLAFAVRGAMGWALVPAYIAAQLAGAAAAAGVLRAVLGDVRGQGVSIPTIDALPACAMEAALTCLLLLVVLMSAHEHSLIGTDAAFGVGAVVATAGLLAGETTGASMNPARSLGPAAVSGQWEHAWIYVVGPVLGAAMALALVTLVLPARNADEVRAAQGEGTD